MVRGNLRSFYLQLIMYQIWYILYSCMKKALFHPKAREVIKSFPDDVRFKLGKAIYLLQRGEVLGMPMSKAMPSVATGVSELRVRGEDGIYRAFYFSKSDRGILVFHAFMKKTQRTPELEIQLAQKRLKDLLNG
jgi:phage-related protein